MHRIRTFQQFREKLLFSSYFINSQWLLSNLSLSSPERKQLEIDKCQGERKRNIPSLGMYMYSYTSIVDGPTTPARWEIAKAYRLVAVLVTGNSSDQGHSGRFIDACRATFTVVTRVNHSHRGHGGREADLDNHAHDPIRPIFTRSRWMDPTWRTHHTPSPSLPLPLSASESITLFPLRNGQDSRKSIIESTFPLPLPAMGLYISPRLPRVLYDPHFHQSCVHYALGRCIRCDPCIGVIMRGLLWQVYVWGLVEEALGLMGKGGWEGRELQWYVLFRMWG